MAKAKLKNITRNVAENCVVLRFRRQHQNWHETFTLSKYGNSWEKAEAAAKRRRTILLKELPEPASRKGVMTDRNQSGAVGVHFSQRKHTAPNGNVYYYPHFYAKWPGCPKRAGIGWSVNQYRLRRGLRPRRPQPGTRVRRPQEDPRRLQAHQAHQALPEDRRPVPARVGLDLRED